jgi:hypothetical protein
VGFCLEGIYASGAQALGLQADKFCILIAKFDSPAQKSRVLRGDRVKNHVTHRANAV